MTCDEARDAFTDLYDGILSGPPLVVLSRHLDECRACQDEWTAFRQAMRAVADLGVDDPASGFASRVMERIERPSWWRRAAQLLVFPLPVKLPLHAAALVLLVVAGWWMGREVPEIEQAARVQTPASLPKTAPPAPPAPVPAPAPLPPSVPGKVAVSPRLKGDAPSPPAAPSAPSAAPPAVPAAKAEATPETRGELVAKPPAAPAMPKPAPMAEVTREAPSAPAAPASPPAPRTTPESSLSAKGGTAPPVKSEALPKVSAGPPVPTPATEAERLMSAPRPSPAPSPGGVTAQKERSEREALLSEKRAMARDASERAVSPEASRRTVAPSPAPPPLASGAVPRQAFPVPGVTATLSADERFSSAANAFAAREYGGAAEGFRTFLAEHPHDSRAAEARFYLADSLFAQGRYGEAALLYAEFLKEQPDHRLAVTALYRQGLARLAAGESSGCALLKSALERAPSARDAAAAKDALARCR